MCFLGHLREQSKEEGLLERIKFLWDVFFGLKGYPLKMLDEDKAISESKFETFLQPSWVALVVSNGDGFFFFLRIILEVVHSEGVDSSDKVMIDSGF